MTTDIAFTCRSCGSYYWTGAPVHDDCCLAEMPPRMTLAHERVVKGWDFQRLPSHAFSVGLDLDHYQESGWDVHMLLGFWVLSYSVFEPKV